MTSQPARGPVLCSSMPQRLESAKAIWNCLWPHPDGSCNPSKGSQEEAAPAQGLGHCGDTRLM